MDARKGRKRERMKPTDLKDIYLGAVEKDYGSDVKVYLINTSDEPQTVLLSQGAHAGDLDGVMDLGQSKYRKIVIPARGSTQIDHMDDAGQLEFMTTYTLRAGDHEYFDEINHRSFSKERNVDIPILNENGYLGGFSRTVRF